MTDQTPATHHPPLDGGHLDGGGQEPVSPVTSPETRAADGWRCETNPDGTP